MVKSKETSLNSDEFCLIFFSFAVGQVRPRPAKSCNFPGPRGAGRTLFGAIGETEINRVFQN